MTQEDRYLLIKDLSARLLYGVLVHYCDKSHTLYTNDFVLNERLLLEFRTPDCCVELKPYLRPMSSMTEEEKEELNCLCYHNIDVQDNMLQGYLCGDEINDVIDWLNKNMFDYRGLIEKGLALEALDGIYNK